MLCNCPCHKGKKIFCSCFKPCCHEPYKPEAEQTPRPERAPVKIEFKTFTMPVIGKKGE